MVSGFSQLWGDARTRRAQPSLVSLSLVQRAEIIFFYHLILLPVDSRRCLSVPQSIDRPFTLPAQQQCVVPPEFPPRRRGILLVADSYSSE